MSLVLQSWEYLSFIWPFNIQSGKATLFFHPLRRIDVSQITDQNQGEDAVRIRRCQIFLDEPYAVVVVHAAAMSPLRSRGTPDAEGCVLAGCTSC